MKSIYLTFLGLVLFVACKHNHPPASETLKQAYAVQQEALEIDKGLQSQLTSKSIELSAALQQRRANWLKNMVEIPGMDHDHSNCSHNHAPSLISVTDEEMLEVQQVWKDSILVIQKDILREGIQ